MVRPENITARLAAYRRYRDLLDRYVGMAIETVRADDDLRGAMERYLYLAVQAVIDMADMLCRHEKLGAPESMSHSFTLLRESGRLRPELAESLIQMIGFRNALAHGYENLDYGIVGNVLKHRLTDLDAFAEFVERRIS